MPGNDTEPLSFEEDVGYKESDILKMGEGVGLRPGTTNLSRYKVFVEKGIKGNKNNMYLFRVGGDFLYFDNMTQNPGSENNEVIELGP